MSSIPCICIPSKLSILARAPGKWQSCIDSISSKNGVIVSVYAHLIPLSNPKFRLFITLYKDSDRHGTTSPLLLLPF